ncbi:DUF2505 domain-containing protein [Corynebacterium felinum]|uniref:DUF2505 domain-containing protein n=1 Tax=Corynebacterium felinum TaxID=131318 RepID=A0ABU2B7D4_9CORY|nr:MULTISPECIES: DUF2505 domain-containing protein [Corynebacterium]MDF5819986.1 DUF2505 domain-containing protein [Corynebacterium felinum]MDO4761081.1 DUF2505 domain-containing protein [Corynebacterium sp.]MDR7354526.1 hypothetical protein [Corynebacterium felinum]WJY93893.1 hypothetical protein CFELI_01225 [Corynebacterium felinum]
MTTRSENTVTINQPASKVHAALTNADYWAHIAATLSPEPGEVHEFSLTDGGAEVVLYEVLPLDILPEAVRAMISQALKVKRVVTVGALDGESASLSYTADVKGTPVDFKGDIALSGAGDSTSLSYSNEVSVNIPFMGPAIEPKVADALGELFANEAALTDAWIAANL